MSELLDWIELQPSASPRKLSRPKGYTQVALAVGLNGETLRLLVPDSAAELVFATTQEPGHSAFARTETEESYDAIFVIDGPGESRELAISGVTAAFPKIELLPNGEVLIVAKRCYQFADGGHELNARLYDSHGHLKRQFLLGDGINHVQAGPRGEIWVGYSDEGVFGNYGWPLGQAFGAAGLSCFNDQGEKLWDFRPPDGFDHICECYALNVCGSGVWAYYYMRFPVAHVDANRNVRCWTTDWSGAKSLAVGGNQVLLYGGYGDNATACNLLRFKDSAAELAAIVTLDLPVDVQLEKATVIGRGGDLHVFSGDDWYRFSVETIRHE